MGRSDLRQAVVSRRALAGMAILIAASVVTAVLVLPAGSALWTQLATSIFQWQLELNRALTTSLRAVRDEGAWAAAGLVWLSFAYGVLHAAGPGHGKAVISAYVLADGRRLRQGLVLAWSAAVLQAVVAIALVTAVVLVLGLAARQMEATTLLLERFGYGLIIVIGAVMAGSAVRRVLTGPHAHHHGDRCHDHPHSNAYHGGPSLRQGLVAVAAGMRPCSGALLVLAFAKAAGVFMAGILATIAMSVGTALTVSALAVLAFVFRRLAITVVAADGRWLTMLETGLAAVTGAALVLLGSLLLVGSFAAPASPFRL